MLDVPQPVMDLVASTAKTFLEFGVVGAVLVVSLALNVACVYMLYRKAYPKDTYKEYDL